MNSASLGRTLLPGVDFDNIEAGSSAFFDSGFGRLGADQPIDNPLAPQLVSNKTDGSANADAYRPISPDQTPSLQTYSPRAERKIGQPMFQPFPDSVSPQDLTRDPKDTLRRLVAGIQPSRTPAHTSDERQRPVLETTGWPRPPPSCRPRAPRATVSYWGKDEPDVQFHPRTGQQSTSDSQFRYTEHDDEGPPAPRDEIGRWVPDAVTGHAGLDPANRPAGEGPSMNELAAQRRSANGTMR